MPRRLAVVRVLSRLCSFGDHQLGAFRWVFLAVAAATSDNAVVEVSAAVPVEDPLARSIGAPLEDTRGCTQKV